MTKIFVATIFLFSQITLAAPKSNQERTKKFEIENQSFSGLLLTKDEIIHLSDEDKTKYLFSMIALAQIVEGSQRFHMGYDESVTEKTVSEKFEDSSSRLQFLFQFLIPEAQAFVFVLARGALLLAEPVLSRAAAWVATRAVPIAAGRAGAVVAVSEPVMVKGGIDTGTKVLMSRAAAVQVVDKEALEIAKKSAIENAKKLKDLEVGLQASAKNKTGFMEAGKKYETAKDQVFNVDKEKFLAAGGNAKDFEKLVTESGIKKVFMWPFRNKTSLVTGGLAAYGADTIALEKTGMSLTDMLGQTAMSAYHLIVPGTDLSIPAPKKLVTATSDTMAAAATAAASKTVEIGSKKEKEKTCLFGGVPSHWKEFEAGEIKCTRPTAGSSETCKAEDGKFKCQDYGIKLTEGSIEPNLCIPTYSLNNLTVRCSAALISILQTKKSTVDPATLADYVQKNFGEVIKSIEAGDHMKDLDGKAKSIKSYCDSKSTEQSKECDAIREVLAVLKDTKAPSIIAARPIVAASAPSETPSTWGGEAHH